MFPVFVFCVVIRVEIINVLMHPEHAWGVIYLILFTKLCGLLSKFTRSFIPCYSIYRTVRAISSDRGKVVSGSDDQSVLVWDKQTTQLLEELKGHDSQVSLKH